MMNQKGLAIVVIGVLFGAVAGAVTLHSVEFNGVGRNSEIDIQGNAPLFYEQDHSAKDQIILRVQGELGTKVKRQIDASAFEFSSVKKISTYAVPGKPKETKVVVQLRQDVEDLDIHREGNQIKVRIPNQRVPQMGSIRDALKMSAAADETPAPPSDPAGEAAPPDFSAPVSESAPLPAESSDSPATSQAPQNSAAAGAPSAVETVDPSIPQGVTKSLTPPEPATNPAEAAMDQFVKNREAKSFTGRPITLKVKDAELVDVFRLIGESSGFNIVIAESVKGKVTMNMEGVPWDQVLDVILRTHQLGAERNGNLLRVTTLKDLTAERTQELTARRANEAVTPRITKIFSISYANLDDMVKILTGFTQQNAEAKNDATAAVVQADKRTNSIIVRDTNENIEKMKKLIELLDTQTPQVMIEAKIIEASESFSKSMGGALAFSHVSSETGQVNWFGGFNTANPNTSLVGTTTTSSAFASSAKGENIFGYSPRIGGFLSGLTASALLSLAESENSIKVVSSPKTVVLDHEKANILQSTPVLVPVALSSTTGASTSGEEIKFANLSMEVTPSVTNEGSVLMQLSLSRDVPQKAEGSADKTGVAQRNMSTKVIVDSGATLVIGGVYSFRTADGASGLPGLRKIPLLGFLFGSETKETSKSELFFFITPRVLNPREAGLGG